MTVPVSLVKWILSALLAAWVGWLAWLWQPALQVELHTLNLLKRASVRDWPEVSAMMSPDYRDVWNADRTEATDQARELFSHFFALQITVLEPLRIGQGGDDWTAQGPVGIFGSGTPVAYAVMDEVREAGGPFTFRWRKNGVWPWQWSLVSCEHGGLQAKYGRLDR